RDAAAGATARHPCDGTPRTFALGRRRAQKCPRQYLGRDEEGRLGAGSRRLATKNELARRTRPNRARRVARSMSRRPESDRAAGGARGDESRASPTGEARDRDCVPGRSTPRTRASPKRSSVTKSRKRPCPGPPTDCGAFYAIVQ